VHVCCGSAFLTRVIVHIVVSLIPVLVYLDDAKNIALTGCNHGREAERLMSIESCLASTNHNGSKGFLCVQT